MASAKSDHKKMAPEILNSSEVIDFVVNQANGVKGLVDAGIDAVPDRYILPPERRFDHSKVTSTDAIPVIDVSNWDDPEVARSIQEAASKWGFFQIVNHGIPEQVLEKLKEAAHGFFALPAEERKIFWKGNSPSRTVFMSTSFSPHAEAVLEWKDFLMFVFGSGDDELWPAVCKDQVVDYMKRAEPVIRKLLKVLMMGLGVDEIDNTKEYALMGSPIIDFNYYPPCPNPELTAAIGPHSDISTITVLFQDDNGGLYLRGLEEDNWIHIPPVNGALVVNIGDILQIMSNDHYKSVEHRAVGVKSRSRVSIPIFVNPGPDALCGPLPEVLHRGEKPLYKPVVYSDYFNYFFSKGHEGKKTIEFARI